MKRIAAASGIALVMSMAALAMGPPPAPEIDPGSKGAALALVSAVVLMARRRAKH